MASTFPAALRYARSGAITSTPSACSAFGNIRPQSITTRSPPDSTTMQFIPTSPRPPSGMMRTGAGVVAISRRILAGFGLLDAPMDPLAKVLNPPQLEAVRHGEGPLLILAGAGSGKTRVLTHRIAHLLREKLARPAEILAVTFTNKAAGELRERVEKLVGPDAERLWVATFHAAGARILRREAEALGLTRSFAIYDDADQLAEAKRATSDLGFDVGTARQYLARIDRWKNAGLLPAEVQVAEYDVPGKTALKVYARYQAALQASNAVDFGDLIVRVIELFKKRDDILQGYAGRFRHILVDEFQDTNPAQYQRLRLLASVHGNLGVVGDDDQSIYRWRGAEVDNILDFPKHFPGTRVVRLEQNYRSSGRILAAAHAIIEKNERRARRSCGPRQARGRKYGSSSPRTSATRAP